MKHGETQEICPKHGFTKFRGAIRKKKYKDKVYEYPYTICCQCEAERTAQSFRDVKARLVSEFGGKCSLCGYNKSVKALQFHHRDPNLKEIEISKCRSYSKAKKEADKCSLICANCHAELH